MFWFPFTNFHELNLDWILSVVKQAKEVFDNGASDIQNAVDTSEQALQIAEQAAAAQIVDGSITTVKIADNAVTKAKLSSDLQAKVLKGATTPIPSANDSTVVTLNGLTTSHQVIYWGFSASAENDPPCDISILVGNGNYTIVNNGGTTIETITPLFASPLNI